MSRDILSKRVVWLNQILAHLYVKSGRISVKNWQTSAINLAVICMCPRVMKLHGKSLLSEKIITNFPCVNFEAK